MVKKLLSAAALITLINTQAFSMEADLITTIKVGTKALLVRALFDQGKMMFEDRVAGAGDLSTPEQRGSFLRGIMSGLREHDFIKESANEGTISAKIHTGVPDYNVDAKMGGFAYALAGYVRTNKPDRFLSSIPDSEYSLTCDILGRACYNSVRAGTPRIFELGGLATHIAELKM